MEYRYIPGTEERISVIGLGSCYTYNNFPLIEQILDEALARGINYFDTVMIARDSFDYYRKAFGKVDRSSYNVQMHFGAVYGSGKYEWTRNVGTIKKDFEIQLEALDCQYADVGLIHCIDTKEDFDDVMKNGLWKYALGMRESGKVRHIGCSTHNPDILRRFIDTNEINIAMFSVNMAYDYANTGEYAMGEANDRYKLYKECECAQVGLVVMKPYGGKRLLVEELSPFKRSFSTSQCIQYDLDRPAVLTVVPGVSNIEHLNDALYYLDADPYERDYCGLAELKDNNEHGLEGVCVYCDHCLPCPIGIDIGLVNKYYDLAVLGDRLAEQHYRNLSVGANECIQCGKCERACPFKVKQTENMKRIAAYFS